MNELTRTTLSFDIIKRKQRLADRRCYPLLFNNDIHFILEVVHRNIYLYTSINLQPMRGYPHYDCG